MPETQFTQVQYTLQGLMNQIQMGQIGNSGHSAAIRLEEHKGL